MAWDVDENTMAVSMHKGNTGAYWVELTLDDLPGVDDDEFVAGDVAIYEVYIGETTLIHREFDLQPSTPTEIEPGDGKFLIAFVNSDTDTWADGTYNSEICMVLNPVRSNGSVVSGDTVRTVVQSTVEIKPVKIVI